MKNVSNYLAGLSATAQRKEQARGIKAVDDQKPNESLNPYVESHKQSFTPEIKQVLDYVFETLWGANPAWRSGFKSRKEMINYKTQLGRAMQSAGINTMEKVEDGLIYAIQQPGAFMPSTGDFVTWCKDIADVKRVKREAVERSQRITDEKRLLASEPWETRQTRAKSAIAEMRKHLGG